MIRGKEFHPIIERMFGDVRGYLETEQIQVNCPKCQQREGLSIPDGRFNLEINTAKRLFRCWKCDVPKFSGGLKRLIRTYGTKFDYDLYVDYAGDFFYYGSDENIEDIGFLEMPKEFISFKDMTSDLLHTEPYQYMVLDRKIKKDLLFKYNIGFCLEGKYKNRILIPSYNINGELNYFITRAYKKWMKPPYLNPDVNKDRIIFNESKINWDSTIYIVEGIFEVLSFPINIVPMLGKTLSEAMFMKLNEKKPPVIIVLDPDAFTNAIEMFQKIQAIYVGEEDKILLVSLPGKNDLDEIRVNDGKETMNKLLRTARKLEVDDLLSINKYEEGYKTYSRY